MSRKGTRNKFTGADRWGRSVVRLAAEKESDRVPVFAFVSARIPGLAITEQFTTGKYGITHRATGRLIAADLPLSTAKRVALDMVAIANWAGPAADLVADGDRLAVEVQRIVDRRTLRAARIRPRQPKRPPGGRQHVLEDDRP